MKSDTDLQHDVMDELEWEPSIDASRIGVAAKEGVVTLSGSVPIYADKIEAERIAKSIGGVKAPLRSELFWSRSWNPPIRARRRPAQEPNISKGKSPRQETRVSYARRVPGYELHLLKQQLAACDTMARHISLGYFRHA